MHEDFELPEAIDDYIIKGIKKGKRKKAGRTLKRYTGIIACLAIVVFITSIRVSPVFASNVAKIPGLKYLVDMVRYDKGLLSAIDNNYIQNIDKSCEKLGITFKVKDIIADDSGIIIFYSIENKSQYKWPHIRDPKIFGSDGKQLKMTSSYGFGPYDTSTYEGKIDYHFVNESNGNIPDSIIFQTQIAVNNISEHENEAPAKNDENLPAAEDSMETVLNETWTVDFSVDKSKFSGMEKAYYINKSVDMEGQKILFKDIKIYPTKSILSVEFDEANTKKIFAFEDLKLVDENGQEWGRINNGISGSYPGENSQTLNFQSNYFSKPKKLYLTGYSVRALDKKDCYFIVDTDRKKISYSPYDLLFVSHFSTDGGKLSFSAEVRKDIQDMDVNFDISQEAKDANGRSLKILNSGMGSSANNSYINYNIELNDNFKGPITFKIQDYPSKIKGKFKIEIPLDED